METYIPDAPLKDPKADLFRRWPFAKRIAHTVSNRSDSSSIVIGIYGNWGEGKTTVLNFIQTELSTDKSIICVKFNPWLFSTETQLVLSFFNTLAKALDKSLPTRKEKIGKFLSKYGSLIVPITVTPLALFEVSPGRTLQELGKQLSSPELDELKERIESILKTEKKRVVVLMDDIDRLDKQEIYSIFKLVKLTADFEYTAYILAFDFNMVANALSERYAGGESNAGKSFLEKIIQVPLILPKADEISLRQLCFQGIDQAIKDAEIQLTESQTQEFGRHFIDGLEVRLNTPRIGKRYTNALAFALPILKGEVNPVDLMLIEGVRAFYPEIYDFVRKSPEMFHGAFISGNDNEREKARIKKGIDELLSPYPADEATRVLGLLQVLFPKLKAVFSNQYYGEEWQRLWSEQQRIASSDYFSRYFSYTVPEGDIPDSDIEQILAQLKALSYAQIAVMLGETITARNAEKVVLKLRRKEKALNETDSSVLAKALAISGSRFPQTKQMFTFLNSSSQAAILIHRLSLNVPKGIKRLRLAKEVVTLAEPLPFAAVVLGWLRASENQNEAERPFDEHEEAEIGKIVAERISVAAAKETLYVTYVDSCPALLWVWLKWVGPGEVAKYLEGSFDKAERNVLEFLAVFLPTTWGLESGLSAIGDFERSEYDAVVKLIDPNIILRKLVSIYGDDIMSATSIYPHRTEPVDTKVAYQFAAMHYLVTKRGQSETDKSKEEPPTQAT